MALIVFIGAVVCIVYALINALRAEEESETRAVLTINNAEGQLFQFHRQDKVESNFVVQMSEHSGTTQTVNTFSN